MDDPVYVDDPFEDTDNSWRYMDDLPEEYLDVVARAFTTCGRTSKTFRTKAEKRKWVKITGQMEKGIISEAWVNHCIAFAKKRNSGGGYGVKYTFDTLTKYIQNKAAMTDWHSQNPAYKSGDKSRYELPD